MQEIIVYVIIAAVFVSIGWRVLYRKKHNVSGDCSSCADCPLKKGCSKSEKSE